MKTLSEFALAIIALLSRATVTTFLCSLLLLHTYGNYSTYKMTLQLSIMTRNTYEHLKMNPVEDWHHANLWYYTHYSPIL